MKSGKPKVAGRRSLSSHSGGLYPPVQGILAAYCHWTSTDLLRRFRSWDRDPTFDVYRIGDIQTETIMASASSMTLDGPSQARLASPFGGRQLITRKVAASILGVDTKTLTAMREQRVIEGVRTASGEFRFSETDIRAYLANSETVQIAR